MIDLGMKKIPYGGDWNPEQWEREIWDQDIEMFKEAGIDLLTINVFAWTRLQPSEETYDFSLLDEMLALLKANGMLACMATSTAAHPAWMATKYPDILRVDFQGRKRKYGDRHNSCPSSPTYRHFAPRLAEELAKRYKDEDTIALWHVSNEYTGICYCENCEKSFRAWLKNRYQTLDALNQAWNTTFWSQTLTDWDEIVVPNQLTVQWAERGMCQQGLVLDYTRFNSDNHLECYTLEHEAIRKHIPDAVITTNLMGAYKQYNYRDWAKKMDVVSWDCYPSPTQPYSHTSLIHDLMRGIKDGQPFLLMEQTPSQTNWQPYNWVKRPGQMRLGSYQAVAHGADSVLFFQMRQSVGACEKFHGAVIDHTGRNDTRVFREVAALGAELQKLGPDLIGSTLDSEVALWFDWDSWWASENSAGPSVDLHYMNQVSRYYSAFNRAGIQVDVVGPGSDLSKYRLLVTPVMYLLHPEDVEAVTSFVQNGGTLVSSFLTGVADASDRVFRGGAPGPLREVFGLWSEEIDALPPGQKNSIVMQADLGGLSGTYECNLLFDLLRLGGAEVLATYGSDFYAGHPALTRNLYGKGTAYYVATSPEEAFLQGLVHHLCQEAHLKPVLENLPTGVEATRRSKGGRDFLFLLNHNAAEVEVNLGSRSLQNLLNDQHLSGTLTLKPRDVIVAEEVPVLA
ncbi:beta-galactosidase [Deinococcus cellulosilyticus]|uniref:Beta-galactosidase n=1 Tax=Deinococcus cellulosilyticus (strain DSM 18568 / NBRC 106333 / KACC 11606 / 5516J-15) TaxID=1223518 RepID=A0A511N340_DEIC1|nr:beta-galactosidase [Deinococcus cellulosilyticus]GEM47275.1 beta-galactosidase [Deinococcus cellulosilyticus NBRC 106333 = KACC 11606]